jgi:hypothetical protein
MEAKKPQHEVGSVEAIKSWLGVDPNRDEPVTGPVGQNPIQGPSDRARAMDVHDDPHSQRILDLASKIAIAQHSKRYPLLRFMISRLVRED